MATLLQTLHGSCACGRNRYVVEVPKQQAELAEVRYDNTSASRKSHKTQQMLRNDWFPY
jgi:hypothetical protein